MALEPASNQQIFEQAFLANPRNYTRRLDDPSPVVDMLGSSPALDLLRQYLPDRLGSTTAGQALAAYIPKGPDPESLREKARRALQNLPLGGYGPEQLSPQTELRAGQGLGTFDVARAGDDQLRRQTVRVGMVPTADLAGEVPTPSLRAGAAQAAGALAADVTTDGARNIWWFLNAPQALGSLAVLAALHEGGKAYRPEVEGSGPLLKHRGLRLAATMPAVLGITFGIGNATRLPGYKAAVPSASDPTKASDPVAEALSRYFLGRSGGLLSYEEFVQERPDVSRDEYERYKAYLFGSASPLKATLDGIHGPEVTFLGKSIPVATGLLPAVAAAVGAGYGMRRGAQRLKQAGAFTRLRDAEEAVQGAYGALQEAKRDLARPEESSAYRQAKAQYDAALRERDSVQQANDLTLFKQSAGLSAAAMAGTGIVGQLLESIRRGVKGPAPQDEALETQVLPS